MRDDQLEQCTGEAHCALAEPAGAGVVLGTAPFAVVGWVAVGPLMVIVGAAPLTIAVLRPAAPAVQR